MILRLGRRLPRWPFIQNRLPGTGLPRATATYLYRRLGRADMLGYRFELCRGLSDVA